MTNNQPKTSSNNNIDHPLLELNYKEALMRSHRSKIPIRDTSSTQEKLTFTMFVSSNNVKFLLNTYSSLEDIDDIKEFERDIHKEDNFYGDMNLDFA